MTGKKKKRNSLMVEHDIEEEQKRKHEEAIYNETMEIAIEEAERTGPPTSYMRDQWTEEEYATNIRKTCRAEIWQAWESVRQSYEGKYDYLCLLCAFIHYANWMSLRKIIEIDQANAEHDAFKHLRKQSDELDMRSDNMFPLLAWRQAGADSCE